MAKLEFRYRDPRYGCTKEWSQWLCVGKSDPDYPLTIRSVSPSREFQVRVKPKKVPK